MAVTHYPIYVQTPKLGRSVLAAANTARDGSGTVPSIATIGSNGGKVKRVVFTSAQATAAASSAMVGRFFTSTDGGTTWDLRAEVAIATATASITVIGAQAIIVFPDGLDLPASAQIAATISVYAGVQDRMQVLVEYGDF